MSGEMRAIAMGVHVLDVLVRPVEAIPEGQGGAAGRGDPDHRRGLGRRHRADPRQARRGGPQRGRDRHRRGRRHAARAARARRRRHRRCCVRRDDVQTSASVLPIRPNGERPGVPRRRRQRHLRPRRPADWDAIGAADHLHLGGPEFMGGEAAAPILARARERGVVTSADVLAPGEPGLLEWIAPALSRSSTTCCPNDEQVLGFTGADDLEAGCRALRRAGRRGASPPPAAPTACCSSTPTARERIPAFEVEVVDTTGCGDAFSAGFLRGLALGRDRPRRGRARLRGRRAGGAGASAPTTATSTSQRSRSWPARAAGGRRAGVRGTSGLRREAARA